MSDNSLHTYEFTGPGFDGGSDDTDHLVLWIQTTEAQAKDLAELLEWTLSGVVRPDNVWDYQYPKDALAIVVRAEELEAKPLPSRQPKRQTNVEFVTHMMEFSNFGALKQAFILTAIEKYTEQVLASTDEWDMGLFDSKLWHRLAKEVKSELDERNRVNTL